MTAANNERTGGPTDRRMLMEVCLANSKQSNNDGSVTEYKDHSANCS